MGGQQEVNFRLYPGAVKVHQLHTGQREGGFCLALVEGGKFAGADFRRDDEVGSEVAHITEKRLCALLIDPSGACGLRLVLDVFNPPPKAGPKLEDYQIGIVVGSKPSRAVLEGVDNLDLGVRAEIQNGFLQSLGGALMGRTARHRKNQDSGVQNRASWGQSKIERRAGPRPIRFSSGSCLSSNWSLRFCHRALSLASAHS